MGVERDLLCLRLCLIHLLILHICNFYIEGEFLVLKPLPLNVYEPTAFQKLPV